MNIDLTQIQALLRILEKRDVTEFEFEDEQVRLRLVRGRASFVSKEEPVQVVASAPPPAAGTSAEQSREIQVADYITSPFVGTFYSSPGPGKPPFVGVGDSIKPGQTVCIVEAMKLMNEIESEDAGLIEEVLVVNGTPVEFGTKLFRYRKL
jgi:acetyl-CoA carboxylase biotin carboxyl carrier protein